MQRRNFLIGVSGTAVAGSALLGTGAFSRVESQRNVAIQVATDEDAYLGMGVIDESANSTNFAELDENGHLAIDIGDFDDGTYDYDPGVGVNSDSFTYFDDLFRLCNNGKADANISYQLPDVGDAGHSSLDGSWEAPDTDYDEKVVAFYWINDDGDRVIVDEEQDVPLPVGECENIGLRTVTKGIDATTGEALLDGTVVITADSPEAGEFVEDTGGS
jgi:hypothetical protein